MSLFTLALIVAAVFGAAHLTYGRFLARHLELKQDRKTPACEVNDGVDFVPTGKRFLLAQHFSAIAAAGPIVGPILASLWFGWLPVLIWIVAGAVFFGAMHDFSSMVGSVRHKARSIVDIVGEQFGRRGYLAFLGFVWLSLLYVIIAFTDLTSSSFVDPELGGAVAASSMMYLVLGLGMGAVLKFSRVPLWAATLIFLPLVFLSIVLGPSVPLVIPSFGGLSPQQIWNYLLLLYCLVASVIPVWLLLQPRGYLGGFFLYAILAAGFIGLLLGGEQIQYPAFLGFTSEKGAPLFPILFVTVACGACSGFHGIVCSGTTSKQIAKETDCHAVGYGAMLLEGLVAFLALATVMVLAKGSALAGASPDRVYAEGLGNFVQHLGIPADFARAFTLLAFTTFIYDTLDVATRLARYIIQELTGWRGKWGSWAAVLISLAIPLACVSLKVTGPDGSVLPAWKVFWTLFGTSNQLLAALTLMTIAAWMARSGKAWVLAALPMAFILAMTLWSLFLMMKPLLTALAQGRFPSDAIGAAALVLTLLAFLLIAEAVRSLVPRLGREKIQGATGS
ncbi:MAG: carbon starvation protein A [Candidatus Omnitrophica bacterium]|nr:carbon starvation protein A [Candidatus Omnitrophota bacterium]